MACGSATLLSVNFGFTLNSLLRGALESWIDILVITVPAAFGGQFGGILDGLPAILGHKPLVRSLRQRNLVLYRGLDNSVDRLFGHV